MHGWRFSRTRSAPLVTVKSFPAATTEDMESYCSPTIRAQPDELILHVGTNDLQMNTSCQVIDDIVNLADNISQNCTSEVTISSLLKRLDKTNLDSKVTEINNGTFCVNSRPKEVGSLFRTTTSIERIILTPVAYTFHTKVIPCLLVI